MAASRGRHQCSFPLCCNISSALGTSRKSAGPSRSTGHCPVYIASCLVFQSPCTWRPQQVLVPQTAGLSPLHSRQMSQPNISRAGKCWAQDDAASADAITMESSLKTTPDEISKPRSTALAYEHEHHVYTTPFCFISLDHSTSYSRCPCK